MSSPSTGEPGRPPVRPIPDCYWIVPGRLLAGEHPGSLSRATAMDRLRRFLGAGVTCFVDLTEPEEMPAYEALLPFSTPEGRRVEYLREPLPDHDVPPDRASMERILEVIDAALAAGHIVYVHCRAGVGRSAMVIGCWLANRTADSAKALDELQLMWRQSARSRIWTIVPETEEQLEFIRGWTRAAAPAPVAAPPPPAVAMRERVTGALLGLAVGDAQGALRAMPAERGRATAWTQHTALALCTAQSLIEMRGLDAHDQMKRFLRWQAEGWPAVVPGPPVMSDDVVRALATYRWRGQPMAGPHDPRDRGTASLTRALIAALYEPDAAAAVVLAGECSRTTHQSPVVIDVCRHAAAMMVGALRGDAAAFGGRLPYEPAVGLWEARPLRPEVATLADPAHPVETGHHGRAARPDAIIELARARVAVAGAADFEAALRTALDGGHEPALSGALAGAYAGALRGSRAIPGRLLDALPGRERLAQIAGQLVEARARSMAATMTPPRSS